MKKEQLIDYLRAYDGREIKIMEICGTHTASIFKSGIRSLLSPKIKLISGPGCPVCVTPAAYIDRCIEESLKEDHVLLTFGDMMKVPGEKGSLAQAKGDGARVELMVGPMDAIAKAKKNPHLTYVIAAVGFETTAPAYALTLEEAVAAGIKNIKFLTALKRVMPALDWICQHEDGIDGFLCPGHVSVIIGSAIYEDLAKTYHKPCTVAGFEPEHVLAAIYDLVRRIEGDLGGSVQNLYSNAVKAKGNEKALAILEKVFVPGPAMWRGLGVIEDSGLYLKEAWQSFDGGSFGLERDLQLPRSCRCGEVIIGRINPDACPMFGKACTPLNPYGPCMVSAEGACGIWYRNI